MRISLAIDSATADEAHDFVCAYQRTAGLASGEGDPTVTIGGSWSFGITTPPMLIRRAKGLLTEFAALRGPSPSRPGGIDPEEDESP